MSWAYLVECADGSLYAGWTTDLARRMAAHQSGRGAKYTRSRRPVRLAYAEQLADKSAALRREAALKAMTHAQKQALAARWRQAQQKEEPAMETAEAMEKAKAMEKTEAMETAEKKEAPVIQMDAREARRRMEEGRLYLPNDESILAEQLDCLELLYDYNATRPHEAEKRAALLRQMFAQLGENCWVEPPLHANWGGRRVHFGSGVYANFNLTLVDDAPIYVGDCVMFGPNVTIATAAHPIEPGLRQQALQYNQEVRIGSNVWVGAGAVILPGVTIGDDTVIGAGSVVTRDLPAGVVAAGSPCRVLRPIGARDREYYFRDRKIDLPLAPDEDGRGDADGCG